MYRTQRWRRLASSVVSDWVAVHGWVCPGWKRDAHPVAEGGLAVDHVEPLSHGGAPFDRANLSPLCPPCNSRKSLNQRNERTRAER